MKKISLMLAFLISAIVLSSCGMLDFSSFGVSDDNITASEKLVAKWHDDIRSGLAENSEDYFISKNEMFDTITDENLLYNSFTAYFEDVTEYISEDTAADWLARFRARYFSISDYTIDEVTDSDGIVTVGVTMVLPDLDKLPRLTDAQIEDIFMECFAFDVNDEGLFLEELAARKGMDVPTLRNEYTNVGSDIIITDVLEYFGDEFTKCLSMALDRIFENCETENYKLIYTVEKQSDDSWRITEIND